MPELVSSQYSERFLRVVKECREDWVALDVRAIGLKGKDGLWHLRALRVVLLPERPKPQVVGPRTDELWTGQEILALAELEKLVEDVEAGQLQVAGKALVLKPDQNNRIGLSYHYSTRDPRYYDYGDYPTSVHLLGSKGSYNFGIDHERSERMEAELASLDPPWEGYEDVGRNFVGESQPPTVHEVSIHFVAPIGASLGNVQYDGNLVKGDLHGTSRTQRSKIRVAVFEHLAGGNMRRSLARLQRARTRQQWSFRHKLSPDALRVVVVSNYRDFRSGYWTRLVPRKGKAGPLMGAAEYFLDGKDLLTDGLLNPEVKGRKMEPWAAMLFTGLGYQTVPLGALPGELPDLLANGSEDQPLLLIECTQDAPDINDKLGKLSQRSRELEVSLKVDVQPVLLTRLSTEVIPEAHKQKAGEERIALLAREQLIQLGELSAKPVRANEIQAFLESNIPPNATGRNPWGRRRSKGIM